MAEEEKIIDLCESQDEDDDVVMSPAPPRCAVKGEVKAESKRGVKRSISNAEDGGAEVVTRPTLNRGFEAALDARSKGADGDDDLEVLGSAGFLSHLPHSRVNCPENPFKETAKHSEHCAKCYCYVCDAPVASCPSWAGCHCHADENGAEGHKWQAVRKLAKSFKTSKVVSYLEKDIPLQKVVAGRLVRGDLHMVSFQAWYAMTLSGQSDAPTAPEAFQSYLSTGFVLKDAAVVAATMRSPAPRVLPVVAPVAQAYTSGLYGRPTPPPETSLPMKCSCRCCMAYVDLFGSEISPYGPPQWPLLRLSNLSEREKEHCRTVSLKEAAARAQRYCDKFHFGRSNLIDVVNGQKKNADGTYELLTTFKMFNSERQVHPWKPTQLLGGLAPVDLGTIRVFFHLYLKGDGATALKEGTAEHEKWWATHIGNRPTTVAIGQQSLVKLHSSLDYLARCDSIKSGYVVVRTEADRRLLREIAKGCAITTGKLEARWSSKYSRAGNKGSLSCRISLRPGLNSGSRPGMLSRTDDTVGGCDYSCIVERIFYGKEGVGLPEANLVPLPPASPGAGDASGSCGFGGACRGGSGAFSGGGSSGLASALGKSPATPATAPATPAAAEPAPEEDDEEEEGEGDAMDEGELVCDDSETADKKNSATKGPGSGKGKSPAGSSLQGKSAAGAASSGRGQVGSGGGQAGSNGVDQAGSSGGQAGSAPAAAATAAAATVAAAAVPASTAPAGVPGRRFEVSEAAKKRFGYGGQSSTDVTLKGLLQSLRKQDSLRYAFRQVSVSSVSDLHSFIENTGHAALAQDPPDLSVQLYEHQRQNIQWMLENEALPHGILQHVWAPLPGITPPAPHQGVWFSPTINAFTLQSPFRDELRGGFLCDEMGLGKTLSTIGCHLLNPAPAAASGEDWGPSAEVLEAARGLVLQEERSTLFKHKCRGTLVVCNVSLVGQWVEEAKRLTNDSLTIYPYHGSNRKKDPKKLAEYDLVVTTYGVVEAENRNGSKISPLRCMCFWRVVLDESHALRNNTKSSRAVKLLYGKHRWCVTGTPANTKISDISSQLDFLGAPCFNTKLRDYIQNARETTAFLRRVMMRHTQGQKMGGSHILGLPTIHKEVLEVDFTAQERTAYDKYEAEAQKEYEKVRHLIPRVRGSYMMAVITLVTGLRRTCAGGSTIWDDAVGATAINSGFDAAFCDLCNEVMEKPMRTNCKHSFCYNCITGLIHKDESGRAPCPKCKKVVRVEDLQEGPALAAKARDGEGGEREEDSEEEEEEERRGGQMDKQDREFRNGGGSSSNDGGGSSSNDGGGSSSNDSGGSSSGGGASSGRGVGSRVALQSKLDVLVGKLVKLKEEDPSAKSLVFSQFTSTLNYLMNELPKRGFQFRTLQGNMTMKQRTKALQDFQRDPPTTVFLLSVRAGAVGINLTQANYVWMMEPFLNTALEHQAIGRVHRLGQKREVHVTKLLMKNSVETRILALQKAQEANPHAGLVAGSIRKDKMALKFEDYDFIFNVDPNGGAYHYRGPSQPWPKSPRGFAQASADAILAAAPQFNRDYSDEDSDEGEY